MYLLVQLAFSLSLAYEAYGLAYFGPSNGPVHWTSISCSGSEEDIFLCMHIDTEIQNTCNYSTNVGVECSNKSICEIEKGPTCCVSSGGGIGCFVGLYNESTCYCDQACYIAGDCCPDIGFICARPPGELRALIPD